MTPALMVVDSDSGRVYQYFESNSGLGCDGGGVHVFDVSDPTAPTNTNSDLPGTCYGGAIAGTGSLFAIGNQLADSLSVYRPAAPEIHTEITTGVHPTGLAMTSSRLYVAGGDQSTGQSEVRIMDLSSGGQASVVGTYAEAQLSHSQGTSIGQRVFLADRGRLSILDVSQPDKPVEIGSAALPAASGIANWSADVIVMDQYAYAAAGGTLLVFNVGDPTHPTLVSQQDLGVGIVALGRLGGYLYVLIGVQPQPQRPGLEYHLAILDLSDPGHPQRTSDWTGLPGMWNGMTVSGTRAYVTGGRLLGVVDLGDPLNPQLVGTAPFDDTGGDRLAVAGNTVFVAGFSGVDTYNVSDPAHPQPLPTFGGDGGFVSSVAVDGARLYVAYWSGGGVRAFDVSDPSNPTLLGAYAPIPNGDVAASVFAVDGHVLTSTYSGLWALHVP
ncbi:MAG: hypothetical protein JO191_01030 [Mycobacteriaceae bacterium]|nr:hypothetical protein [Mycobacteriaceae bacterium]